jgi:hypothetical protein
VLSITDEQKPLFLLRKSLKSSLAAKDFAFEDAIFAAKIANLKPKDTISKPVLASLLVRLTSSWAEIATTRG